MGSHLAIAKNKEEIDDVDEEKTTEMNVELLRKGWWMTREEGGEEEDKRFKGYFHNLVLV